MLPLLAEKDEEEIGVCSCLGDDSHIHSSLDDAPNEFGADFPVGGIL